VLARVNYHLQAGDVATLDFGDFAVGRVCFVAEGLFMYLEAEQRRDLWRRLADACAVAGQGSLIFDLLPADEEPPPSRVGGALGWLFKRGTGGRGFETAPPDREALRCELVEAGFRKVTPFASPDLPAGHEVPFPEHRTRFTVWLCEQ